MVPFIFTLTPQRIMPHTAANTYYDIMGIKRVTVRQNVPKFADYNPH